MPKNPFEALLPETPELETNGETMEGTFGCKRCAAVSTEAFYNLDAEQFEWDCPDGHPNTYKMKL